MEYRAYAMDRGLAISSTVRDEDRHDHGECEQDVWGRHRWSHAAKLPGTFDERFHGRERTFGELACLTRIPIRNDLREPRDIELHVEQVVVEHLGAVRFTGQSRRTGLDLRHIVAQDLEGKLLAVGEVPMQSGATDAGCASDLVERNIRSSLGDDSTSSVEEESTISCRIASAGNLNHFGIVSADQW